MFRLFSSAALAAAIFTIAVPVTAAAPYCPAGVTPTYGAGFGTLYETLGRPLMGTPVTCEFGTPTGDTAQLTTTGLAYYRRSLNTPMFFNGTTHFAVTAQGIVWWEGEAVDPPQDAQRPQAADCSILACP